MKHFNTTNSDDEILIAVRANIETLNELIDPLFRNNEVGNNASFWIYQTGALQKYIVNKTEVYDQYVYKKSVNDLNLTSEIFSMLFGSIKDTNADAVKEFEFNNQTYWGYS